MRGAQMEHANTVLIAEDHVIQRKMLEDFCTRAHWTVVASVSTGTSVISEYLHYKPDLIVLDINLSEMDGITAIRTLKELGHQPFVIFVTGSLDANHVKAGFELHSVEYITKPYEITDIEKALQKVSEKIKEKRKNGS
jgi:DNA-binding response OmpR family regulator